MKNSKKLLTVLLVVFLLIGAFSVVFATEADEDITQIPDDAGSQNTTNSTNTNDLFNNTNTNTNAAVNTNTNSNTARNTNTNTNTNSNTTRNTNTNNSSTYNNSNLPKAGSSDNIVTIAIIAVFGVSALYAYKKIRDYNLK